MLSAEEIQIVEKLSHAANASIRMGEMSVATDGAKLRTLLGSCLGLALHDGRRKVGGLAHIVLPNARTATDRAGKFVDTAVPALIQRMEELTGHKLNLTAKLAGGASMFSTTVAASIGQQNIETCEKLLGELGIPIVAKHCGGEQGRRMSLDTANGMVLIEIVGQDSIEL
jgi:chemotaxis protein CheD